MTTAERTVVQLADAVVTETTALREAMNARKTLATKFALSELKTVALEVARRGLGAELAKELQARGYGEGSDAGIARGFKGVLVWRA